MQRDKMKQKGRSIMPRPSFKKKKAFSRFSGICIEKLNDPGMTLRHLCKSLIFFAATAFLFPGLLFGENPVGRHRLIHNNDGTDALGNLWFNRRPLSLGDLNAYVDVVARSQVTTYMMCSGSDFFYYRSQYGRLFCDDLDGTLSCGKDTAAYRNFRQYYLNFLNLEKEGTDLIAASLSRAKKNGMEAFITYRMNDLHFNDTTTRCPIVYTDFWHGHPEYWLNDTTPGWNAGNALDFAHQDVRDRKLAIISEQLEKYAMIDGFDLDFMRFIVYFKQDEGRKNAPLMTRLVKDIRAKVDEVSARRGRKILLSARVPPTMEACLDKGLDVKEWVRLGLLDFVSIGIHWTGDPSLPVARFRKELANDSIPLYASIDDGIYQSRENCSHGMIRGMASHILGQGADGIYLFNQYYSEYLSKYNGQLHLEAGDQVCRVMMPQLLQEIGSAETLKGRNKIYCLSDGWGQYGIRPVTPLPLTVNRDAEAAIFVGDDPREDVPKEVILFFRLSEPTDFKIFVNGKKVPARGEKPEYVTLYDRGRGLKGQEKQYAFRIPSSWIRQKNNTILFCGAGTNPFMVFRLELALKYGDVQTCGYF